MVCGLWLLCAPAWAITYECVDASGEVIFTDSPSQLNNAVLEPLTPALSPTLSREGRGCRRLTPSLSPGGRGSVLSNSERTW